MGTTRNTTDLWVETKNELGTLSRMTTPLKENNVNIEYFVGWEEGSNANFCLITNDNAKAKELLTNNGFTVKKENTVTLWEAPNTPGTLNNASTALAEARINTSCIYHATSPNTNTTTVVYYTDNPEKTNEILAKIG